MVSTGRVFGLGLPSAMTAVATVLVGILIGTVFIFPVVAHTPPLPPAGELNMEQSAGIAPARDGNIATQEEFDAALLANSFAAWELFIRRNLDSPLIDSAWRHLRKLECYCDND
jgi:hypothetical protein